jgi:hypothetical protein
MVPALPCPLSAYPADVARRAAVTWGHTNLLRCPTCQGPALVGYLDRHPVAYSCHRCGPIVPAARQGSSAGK